MSKKKQLINFVSFLIEEGLISKKDLASVLDYKTKIKDKHTIKCDLEEWYKGLGIELITGSVFSLSQCPFTTYEIDHAVQNNELILCVPAGLSKQQLGWLFRFDSWVLEDSLYPGKPLKKDFWFKTLKSMKPPFIGICGKEARRKFEDNNFLGFSLTRYMVFLARMKFLTGEWPDQEWWTWLLSYKYDRSGYLIAGFDSCHKLSIHGWMSDFNAKFVGARYLTLPENI